MTRILIADDHAIVRSGLKQIVLNAPDLTVVGEATSSQELLTLARAQAWDLIILDIHMPGRGGLETLKDLKHEFPKLPVLILSMYPEDQYAVRDRQPAEGQHEPHAVHGGSTINRESRSCATYVSVHQHASVHDIPQQTHGITCGDGHIKRPILQHAGSRGRPRFPRTHRRRRWRQLVRQ